MHIGTESRPIVITTAYRDQTTRDRDLVRPALPQIGIHFSRTFGKATAPCGCAQNVDRATKWIGLQRDSRIRASLPHPQCF